MKKILLYIGKLFALALVVILLIAYWPQITAFVGTLLPGVGANTKVDREVLLREMQAMGKLTVAEHTEKGILTATLPGLILEEAQRVTIPYEYRIGLGIDMEQAVVSLTDSEIEVILPPVEMIYDNLLVTGEVEVQDFLFPLTEKRYQEILDTEAQRLRAAHLENSETLGATETLAIAKIEDFIRSLVPDGGVIGKYSIYVKVQ